MKTRGMRTFGALFIVLLFFMGAWIVHPGWSAQADGKRIWGIVRDASNGAPLSATVTLSEVHSLDPVTNITWGGIYEFRPATGYYTLKVEATDYFTQEQTQPFRYDGTELLQFDFALTKFPAKDKTMNVLVTETVGTARNEAPFFPRTTVSGENAVTTYNNITKQVTLSKKPVVRIISVEWEDKNVPEKRNLLPSEFSLVDQWMGTVTIYDPAITAKLDPGVLSPPYFLRFDYVYTTTTAKLNYTPVLPGYVVTKIGAPPFNPATDYTVDVNAGTLTILQNFIWGTDGVTMQWSNPRPIAGAQVALYNKTNNQQLTTLTTNASGGAGAFSLWRGSWEIRTSKPGIAYYYDTDVTTTFISGGETVRILLPFAVNVTGVVADSEGPVTDGVVAFLYCTDGVPLEKKVLTATVNGAGFNFKAYPGNFRLVVDANWHKGKTLNLFVPGGSTYIDSGTHYLDVSLEEKASTAVIFERAGWNNLTVYSNFSYTQDSTIPGLKPENLRDVSLQIDYTFGNGNGLVDGLEDPNFTTWLEKNGAPNVDTNGLLTTNGLYYLTKKNSDINHAYTEFAVNRTGTADYPYIIQTAAYYKTKGTDIISYGKPTYYLNFTGVWDTNTTVYRNKTYTIDLPKRYELTETTFVSPGLEMKNFTRIDLDPKEGTGSPRADMVIRQSANGTARARVKGPVGRFNELNTTLTNYTAVVMAKYNITYSADQSTDPIGKISDANFTWRFEAGPTGTRYTMDPVYNFTVGGEYNVNLTVREAGGNFTYRNFKIIADSSYPVARIWTNISAGGPGTNANGTTVRFNQSVPVRFDSLRSVDTTYSSKAGTIAEAHWDFDGDGVEDSTSFPGKIVNHTFEKPGQFTLKMWVFDGVGHRSANASMTVIVNDTSPPNPDITIYDSAGTVVSTLVEGKTYNFNASRTTDNYDSLNNLTFTWSWGDNTANVTGTGLAGYNQTHTYTTFNNSYKLRLNVTDKGFQGKTPNYNVLERAMTVQVDSPKRPNVAIKSGSLSVNPNNPEEGGDVTITVTVTNEKNRGYAYDVGVHFFVRTGTTYNAVQINPRFFKSGASANTSIPAGEERQVQFVWKADAQGVRAIRIKVTEPSEPYTWETDNTLDSTISVREAGWKGPVIWGLIAFLIFGIPIIYWVVKKFRAGEWSLRREKSEEGEEEKPKKEEASEKAEKKEKKRL